MYHEGSVTLVLIQEITVKWSKASRGAPGATARNRVPEALPLPAGTPTQPWPSRFANTAPTTVPFPAANDEFPPDILLHHLLFSEWSQLAHPSVYWVPLRSRLPEQCMLQFLHWNVPPLTLEVADGRLKARFPWSYDVGAPRREYRPMWERCSLAPGQWMQIRFNGRHVYGDDAGWYYEKHVLNIGWVDTLVNDLFVRGLPNYQITDLADLHETLG